MPAEVLLRHVLGARTWCLLPVTVLADGVDGVVVRISAGTRWLAAVDAAGDRVHLGAPRWRLGPAEWTGNDLTYLMPPGRWYALGLLCPAGTGVPARWYVNFQRPLRRRAWGFDTLDLELDLEADASTGDAPAWRFKDVARFQRLVRRSVLSGRTARQVLAANPVARCQAGQQRIRSLLTELAAVAVAAPGFPADPRCLPPDVHRSMLRFGQSC